MFKPTPAKFGKYLLLERIAVGGMAQLYRAKITGAEGFERLIAIKMIHPHLSEDKDLVNAFIDEAKLAALLNHQNIVQIYDFGLMENSYFIAMEYLLGKDLRYIVHKSQKEGMPLTLEYALYITSRICSGLDYAHHLTDSKGEPLHIIHRDISPQNILITYEGEVKIVDFGIAKAASLNTATPDGIIKGKASYMSPEQASGQKIDFRSDIFSTGIILYELVTQKRMFTGDTWSILAKAREGKFEPPEAVMGGLPPKVYEILRKALAKEVDHRYPSCGEMLAEIEACLGELNWRPSARGLADYMKKLFEEEMEEESKRAGREAGATVADQEETLGKDWEAVEEILEKAKATAEDSSPPKKNRKIFYVAVPVILALIGMVWAFGSKEKPVSAPKEEASRPSFSESSDEKIKGKEAKAERIPKSEKRRAEARALQEKAAGLVEKNPQKAKSLLLKAIELDPKNVQVLFQLGLTYAALQESPQAIRAYQKAIEIDPEFPDAYFNLGYLWAMNKDYPKAEEMYSQVVKLAPPYLDEALFNLGLVQEKQGKRKQGIENIERALKVNPKNEMAKKLLGKLKENSRAKTR